jgi:hypothetical protein
VAKKTGRRRLIECDDLKDNIAFMQSEIDNSIAEEWIPILNEHKQEYVEKGCENAAVDGLDDTGPIEMPPLRNRPRSQRLPTSSSLEAYVDIPSPPTSEIRRQASIQPANIAPLDLAHIKALEEASAIPSPPTSEIRRRASIRKIRRRASIREIRQRASIWQRQRKEKQEEPAENLKLKEESTESKLEVQKNLMEMRKAGRNEFAEERKQHEERIHNIRAARVTSEENAILKQEQTLATAISGASSFKTAYNTDHTDAIDSSLQYDAWQKCDVTDFRKWAGLQPLVSEKEGFTNIVDVLVGREENNPANAQNKQVLRTALFRAISETSGKYAFDRTNAEPTFSGFDNDFQFDSCYHKFNDDTFNDLTNDIVRKASYNRQFCESTLASSFYNAGRMTRSTCSVRGGRLFRTCGTFTFCCDVCSGKLDTQPGGDYCKKQGLHECLCENSPPPTPAPTEKSRLYRTSPGSFTYHQYCDSKAPGTGLRAVRVFDKHGKLMKKLPQKTDYVYRNWVDCWRGDILETAAFDPNSSTWPLSTCQRECNKHNCVIGVDPRCGGIYKDGDKKKEKAFGKPPNYDDGAYTRNMLINNKLPDFLKGIGTPIFCLQPSPRCQPCETIRHNARPADQNYEKEKDTAYYGCNLKMKATPNATKAPFSYGQPSKPQPNPQTGITELPEWYFDPASNLKEVKFCYLGAQNKTRTQLCESTETGFVAPSKSVSQFITAECVTNIYTQVKKPSITVGGSLDTGYPQVDVFGVECAYVPDDF